MALLKPILILALFATLVLCDQNATVDGDSQSKSPSRVVRNASDVAEEPMEETHKVAASKEPLLVQKLKGQEEELLNENNDLPKINRFRRSPKSYKKGGGVAKGGGGCKKGRK